MLSVITATYNSIALLPALIDSLLLQSDQEFEWVVADGGSTDGTPELISRSAHRFRHLILDSRPDCGIYHALNRAIDLSSCDYYLVAGSDDTFDPHAIALFKEAIACSGADIISANVRISGRIISKRNPSLLWLYGPPALISSHAVGIAIRKSLHSDVGLYSYSFSIYSDGDFLLKAFLHGARIFNADFVSGTYSPAGLSNRSHAISLSEHFCSQIANGSNWFLQLILFMLRTIKWGLTNGLR